MDFQIIVQHAHSTDMREVIMLSNRGNVVKKTIKYVTWQELNKKDEREFESSEKLLQMDVYSTENFYRPGILQYYVQP